MVPAILLYGHFVCPPTRLFFCVPVLRYYSDFAELSEKMMTSKKLNEYSSGLPEKHGVGLLLKKGMARLSINKGAAKRQETEFMMVRHFATLIGRFFW